VSARKSISGGSGIRLRSSCEAILNSHYDYCMGRICSDVAMILLVAENLRDGHVPHRCCHWEPDSAKARAETTCARAIWFRQSESLELRPVWVKVASQFRKARRKYLYAGVSFAALQVLSFCVPARLNVCKFFCLIEVPAQSFAKLQPSSPGPRLNCRHTQVQRFCRLIQ